MSTILVTGAAGFIGSHVVQALLQRGDRVIGLDNFHPYYPRELKQKNLDSIRNTNDEPFTFVECDICHHQNLASLFETYRPDSIIHLAARAGVRPSIADPTGYLETNVIGTQRILTCAQTYGAQRCIIASSSSVYGNHPSVPFHEELEVNEPISPYAASKRACEFLAYTHHHLTRIPTACLRFFTVFGPRQRPDLAIHSFLKLASTSQPIPMFGDGTTSRDYTYIDDIVQGILAAHDRIPEFGYRIWNLGGNSPHSLKELIEIIGRVVDKPIRIDARPKQPGDVERTYADIGRAMKELDFCPKTGLEDGIAKQWAWMQQAHMQDDVNCNP